MKKFYIAFSITGSNRFITATKETNDFKEEKDKLGQTWFTIDGIKFAEAQSRRWNYVPEKTGYKLQYRRLMNRNGLPLRHPGLIIARFKELERLGWTVERERFTEHWFSNLMLKIA